MRGKHKNHSKSGKHYRFNNAIISSHGYKKIRVGIKHPLADPNGYAYEHLVVWVSAGNKRPESNELLHHKNHIKTDNRIENLKVVDRLQHNKHHNKTDRVRNAMTGRFEAKKPVHTNAEEIPAGGWR